MTCTHPNTPQAIRRCALSFGKCWQEARTEGKIANKPHSSYPEDNKY